jgi:signal transduction histidine kinase
VIDGARYYQTNKALERLMNGQEVDIAPYSQEAKAFLRLYKKRRKDHLNQYKELKGIQKEHLYFFSHLVHYLKTPVSVIDLLIDNEQRTEENAWLFDQIRNENKRLYNSIEQALTLNRMDQFENDLDICSANVLTSLRKVINDRKQECIVYSIYPVIEYDQDAAYIVTDIKWNELLLDQIISNAIKYSSIKSGTKKLLFRLSVNEKYTSMKITDEGIGIPPYDLERIFLPFFTGENGRRIASSSGVGLYICKRIADKLGHTLFIESKQHIGTTVTVQWLTGTSPRNLTKL